MALYRATIYKRLNALNGEKWVNTYYLNNLVAANALDQLELIAGFEMSCTASAAEVYKLTVRDMATGVTLPRSVSIPGEIATDPINLVPMFNTVRVVLTDNLGRAESKYLRGMIFEANMNGFNITDDLKTFIEENYLTFLLGILGLRGPNNESIEGGSVQQLIQMRQISWHRRERVGYKRGWVPV